MDASTPEPRDARAYLEHRLGELRKHQRVHTATAADYVERGQFLNAAQHLQRAAEGQAIRVELRAVLDRLQ